MTRGAPANEGFLSRWSRLKRAQPAPGTPGVTPAADAAAAATARSGPPTSSVGAEPPATNLPERAGAPAVHPDAAQPPLPAIASLTMDSDYAPFFQPKVPEALRRAAVKKLFADPHFNVMDGLDTYIDDYTQSDPIPPAMLARLLQAHDSVAHASRVEREEALAAQPATAAEATESAGASLQIEATAEVAAEAPEAPEASALPDAEPSPSSSHPAPAAA